MGRISVKSGDWVVVCDGRKALILENIGDAKYPKLHTKELASTQSLAPVSRAPTVPARRIRP
jgi:protein required for attachment to host cells